jgi:DNA replication protein DnaC
MNITNEERMSQLRLFGMLRAFQSTKESNSIKYTPDELLAYLLDAEYDDKHNRKINRLIKIARFRYMASTEEIFFAPDRNLDKNQIMRFASCDFIKRNENILLTGSTGAGKSYIASALGHQACNLGYKVLYFNINKLFSKLKMLKADGSYIKELVRIEKQDLLILDDFGLKPLDPINRHALMEIIEDRHGKRSIIIGSQLPVQQWHDVIGENTIADAILDRIVHSSHRIDLKGESMRKKKIKLFIENT